MAAARTWAWKAAFRLTIASGCAWSEYSTGLRAISSTVGGAHAIVGVMMNMRHGGRPHKDQSRDVHLAVYLTKPEAEAVRSLANSVGMSESALARESLMALIEQMAEDVKRAQVL